LTGFVKIAMRDGIQYWLVAKFKQSTPKFLAGINPPLFSALRTCEMAARKVIPDNDKAVEVIVTFPKSDVSPLESNEFT